MWEESDRIIRKLAGTSLSDCQRLTFYEPIKSLIKLVQNIEHDSPVSTYKHRMRNLLKAAQQALGDKKLFVVASPKIDNDGYMVAINTDGPTKRKNGLNMPTGIIVMWEDFRVQKI